MTIEQGPISHQQNDPWKVRLGVGIIILLLAFVGLIYTNLMHDEAWVYWHYITPVFALICIWFTWYMRQKKHIMPPVTIGQELLHWLGLFLSVFFISVLVDLGIVGKFPASLAVLILLGLTIYIAGVYIERTFIAIGVLLWIFTILVALLQVYIFIAIVPLTIAVAAIIFWIYHRNKTQKI